MSGHWSQVSCACKATAAQGPPGQQGAALHRGAGLGGAALCWHARHRRVQIEVAAARLMGTSGLVWCLIKEGTSTWGWKLRPVLHAAWVYGDGGRRQRVQVHGNGH